MEVKKYLEEVKKVLNIRTLDELAQKIGTSRVNIDKWVYRKKIPAKWKIVLDKIIEEKKALKDENDITVTIYEDVYASAGYGATNSIITPKKTTLSKAFLESLRVKDPKNIEIIKVVGDSMSPSFEDGEYIVVERVSSIDEVKNGNTIIININGELYVKKIIKDPLTGKIYLFSDNNLYEPVELKDELLKRVNIVGIVRGKYKVF